MKNQYWGVLVLTAVMAFPLSAIAKKQGLNNFGPDARDAVTKAKSGLDQKTSDDPAAKTVNSGITGREGLQSAPSGMQEKADGVVSRATPIKKKFPGLKAKVKDRASRVGIDKSKFVPVEKGNPTPPPVAEIQAVKKPVTELNAVQPKPIEVQGFTR